MKITDIKPMNVEAAKQICSWRYKPPYDVYDYLTYEAALNEQVAITKIENADNYICFWNNRTLVAYTSIISKEHKIYMGIGIAPQFCGQGMGETFLNQTILECKRRYSGKEIWVQARSWNERAIKCYLKSGFVEKYRDTIIDRFNKTAEFIFMQYESAVSFSFLNKSDFQTVARQIFDILADNMTVIAPTGNSREEDFGLWSNAVSDGLRRAERQIILIKDDDNLIGFFQYYTNEDTFMMEEIQFKPEYQGKGVFRALYGFLISHIKGDIEYVEAYANISNSKSIGILERLGLANTGLNKNGRSYHFKGNYSDLLEWFYLGSDL